MDDAYAGLQPRAGMPKQYYDGYHYACAIDFEGIVDAPQQPISEVEGLETVPIAEAVTEPAIAIALGRLEARLNADRAQSVAIQEDPDARSEREEPARA